MYTIAIISFPGTWSEVESIRAIERVGMKAQFHKWNDDVSKLSNVDGYFIPGGFSYEDRGRAGMVAARDPLLDFLKEESAKGKPIIGICNGAQILVESGLIPVSEGLRMSLARNFSEGTPAGFLNEWVWITPQCARDRCCTSDWEEEKTLHIPISHGEGRYITKDADLIEELRANDQIAFAYSDEEGNVSEDPLVTPNGSTLAIAGICNSEGNVVALMPHPERTENAAPYFASMRKWIERGVVSREDVVNTKKTLDWELQDSPTKEVEVFIDTLITNNEERTVEQALRKVVPNVSLKQYRYYAPASGKPEEILGNLALFNANKHVAYIRRGEMLTKWDADAKKEEPLKTGKIGPHPLFLRFDDINEDEGICYACSVFEEIRSNPDALEVLANPHASRLEVLAC